MLRPCLRFVLAFSVLLPTLAAAGCGGDGGSEAAGTGSDGATGSGLATQGSSATGAATVDTLPGATIPGGTGPGTTAGSPSSTGGTSATAGSSATGGSSATDGKGGSDSGGGDNNLVQVQWSADSLVVDVPRGRDCDLVNAQLDFDDFSEGVASMRVESPVGNVQGAMGCTEVGQTTLTVDWNSGEWLCMYFDMKVDGAFNWDSNQRKFKMQRMVNSGRWTMYLNEWGVDISECSTCGGCAGGDQCTTMNYDMRPAGAGGVNPVEQWQSYTVGVRLESGSGAADGGMRLWVDGSLADSADSRVYCPDCVGPMVGAWGTFGMSPYPQSPDGTIWFDDFLFTAGPDECTPRP